MWRGAFFPSGIASRRSEVRILLAPFIPEVLPTRERGTGYRVALAPFEVRTQILASCAICGWPPSLFL